MQVSPIQPPLTQVIISPPSPHATEPSLHPQAPAAYPSSPPTSPLPFQTSHVPHPSTSPVPSDVQMNRQIRKQESTPATSSAVRQAPHSHPTTALRSTALRVLPTSVDLPPSVGITNKQAKPICATLPSISEQASSDTNPIP